MKWNKLYLISAVLLAAIIGVGAIAKRHGVALAGGSDLPAASNLIAYWALEEAVNNTRVDSHASFDATDPGSDPTQVSGLVNNGADFEATSSQYLTVADAAGLTPAGAFSVSFHMKRESAGLNHMPLCKASGVSAGEWYVWFTAGTDILTFRIVDDSATANIDRDAGTALTSTAAYYHIVCTYDGSGTTGSAINMYVDGSLDNSTTGSSGTFVAMEDTAETLDIGRRSDGFYGDGIMDEIGFWNIELTADQVTALYNGGSGVTYSDLP